MKSYVCIQFENDKFNDIVHRSWMVSECLCKYPPAGSHVEQLAREKRKPESTWKLYNCTVLCQGKTFERCAEKAYHRNANAENTRFPSPGNTTNYNGSNGPFMAVENLSGTIARKSSTLKRAYTGTLCTPVQKVRKQDSNLSNDREVYMEKILSSVHKLEFQMEEVVGVLRKVQNEVRCLKRNFNSERNDAFLITPASNNKELETTLNNIKDKGYDFLGRKVSQPTLRATVRAFLKTFLKKELAMTYSWSGLGIGRRRTKTPFRGSDLYITLKNTLLRTNFSNCPENDLGKEVSTIFAQVSDWDGGRACKWKESCNNPEEEKFVSVEAKVMETKL